jgi:hypothetical protein
LLPRLFTAAGDAAAILMSAQRRLAATVLGSATSTMAIAVGISPTRAVAPVDDIRAANFITYNPADDGANRPGDDGSHAGANADAFHFAGLRAKRRSQ